MRRVMLSAALGVATVSTLPRLPGAAIAWLLFLFAPLMLRVGPPQFRRAAAPSLVAFIVAFAWGILFGQLGLDGVIPPAWERVEIELIGVVASLPRVDPRSQRFEFSVERVVACPNAPEADGACPTPGKLLLSWYGPEPIQPGQRWRFTVRLNRPHGNRNPGAFDYEAWLCEKGISGTGYVRPEAPNRLLGMAPGVAAIDRLRAWVRARINSLIDPGPLRGLAIALVIGESQQIGSHEWSVLTRTGTNHLLIISGLHVGLVAGLAYRIARAFGGRILPALSSARTAPAAAIGAALAFSALAGFGLPAQRASVMVIAGMASLLCGRALSVSFSFCAALVTVLLLDPLAVRGSGFWLSFGSVMTLLYVFGGRVDIRRNDWRQPLELLRLAIRVQGVLFLALLPLLGYRTMQVPLLAPLVNLAAVPWISCVVVPVLLGAALLLPVHDAVAGFALESGRALLGALWSVLTPLADLHAVWTPPTHSAGLAAIAFCGALILLAPAALPGRWLGAILMLPFLLPVPSPLGRGEALVTVLDVGQGLAIVVETATHALLFDSGGHPSDRYDLGEAVVLPYLRHLGIRHLDRIVISHGEADHAGGVTAVEGGLDVREISSGSVERVSPRVPGRLVRRCRAGQGWRWDGIDFRMLHPGAEVLRRENNRSCVLRIRSGDHAILLPGDIERDIEQTLVEHGGLQAEVLIAPHHGSTTSSSLPFIHAVDPDVVIYSAGYNSRFHHPHPMVSRRYRLRGIAAYSTADEGAVSIRLSRTQEISVSPFRAQERHYWDAVH